MFNFITYVVFCNHLFFLLISLPLFARCNYENSSMYNFLFTCRQKFKSGRNNYYTNFSTSSNHLSILLPLDYDMMKEITNFPFTFPIQITQKVISIIFLFLFSLNNQTKQICLLIIILLLGKEKFTISFNFVV